MNYFPVNLNLKEKHCFIIGGGKVAERKVLNLIEYTDKITVISDKFSEKLLNLQNKITLIHDKYNKKYLKKHSLIFICTNSKKLNEKVYYDAKELNCLVNVVTHPQLCDFTIPSVIRRGDLKIAISTNGKSPAIAKIVKTKIDKCIEKEYEELINIMGKIREKQLTINETSDINRELFYKFIDTNVLNDIKNRNRDAINAKIEKIFGFSLDGF